MSLATVLTPLPVLIPTIAAAATLVAGRSPRLQQLISLTSLTAVVAVCAALLYLVDRDGTVAVQVGGWGQSEPGMGPLGITLVANARGYRSIDVGRWQREPRGNLVELRSARRAQVEAGIQLRR